MLRAVQYRIAHRLMTWIEESTLGVGEGDWVALVVGATVTGRATLFGKRDSLC